ncbi:MAG TPA: lamin tail domain-containing protein [Candidatus Latescibacteria bacterium]|nr:lamin tail domain-containing protein [Candidatus Latescibacterota bacterium]
MGFATYARAALILAATCTTFSSPTEARRGGPESCPLVISEIMVNPSGTETSREFIELFNVGTGSVNLGDYVIGDTNETDAIIAVSSGLVLKPGRFALILDPGYFSTNEPYPDIPAEALVVTIGDAAFGRGGLVNSRANTVVLRSSGGCEQRVSYLPEAVFPGLSLEKIDVRGPDTPDNWAVSLVPDGTPGRPNSRRRNACDVSLRNASASPDTLHPPEQLTVRFDVLNSGTDTTGPFPVILFADRDRDSVLSAAEDTLVCWNVRSLQPAETFAGVETIPVSRPFSGPLMLAAMLPGDENPRDNTQALRCVIGLPARSIVINEIMAYPSDGEGQWVEVLNAGADPLSLAGSLLKTATGSGSADYGPLLYPGDYLVIAALPEGVRTRYGIGTPLCGVTGGFPYLSRSASSSRRVSFLDATGTSIDEAHYPVPEQGRSLERADSASDGSNPASWAPSWAPARATPGLRNSASYPPPRGFDCMADPIPATDTVGIRIITPEHGSSVSLTVFDMAGREIRTLLTRERLPAESHVRWDGTDGSGRQVPTGVYILHIEVVSPDEGKHFRRSQPLVIVRRR